MSTPSGLIGRAAQYWAEDNARFEASRPSFGGRMVRALNPATSFGSAMGAMHTAAGRGDKVGMGLAAAQSVPVFGALRAVAIPAAGAVKAAQAVAPSVSRTAAAVAASGAGGAAADSYESAPAAASLPPAYRGPQQPRWLPTAPVGRAAGVGGVTYADLWRLPAIPRTGGPGMRPPSR